MLKTLTRLTRVADPNSFAADTSEQTRLAPLPETTPHLSIQPIALLLVRRMHRGTADSHQKNRLPPVGRGIDTMIHLNGRDHRFTHVVTPTLLLRSQPSACASESGEDA